ncbi:hypothetical protein OAO01_01905 [Oligoflexia bacterium]|nr:hypothetical protein [Oligoflexia bacterium]
MKNGELEILNRIFVAKYNSLAHYISEASPYIGEGEQELFKLVKEIGDEDHGLMQDTAEAIENLSGVVSVQPHDLGVGELNYLALGFLTSLLIKNMEQQLTIYQQDLNELQEGTAASGIVKKVIKQIDSRLSQLKAMYQG